MVLRGVVKNQTDNLRFEERKMSLEILKDEISDFENAMLMSEMAKIMSHEIRNPMTTVRGFLQMFMYKPSLALNHEYLQVMIDELDSVNSLISNFLSVGEGLDDEFIWYDLNQIIASIAPLMQIIGQKEDKFLQINLQDIPQLFLNMKEIRYLILIMCRNSYDAMEAGGTVTILTRLKEEHVILEIQDEGKGIEPKILDKLGTPFITTKPKGTGLGLSFCYNICKRHEAAIAVETGQKGTKFTIRFNR